MKLIRKFWLFIFLGLISNYIFASEQTKAPLFKDGKGYYSYKKPLNVTLPNDGRILITYFYQYGCEICLNGDDYLKQYVARNADKVILERVVVSSKDNTISAGLNAAFEELGRTELSDLYLFDSAYKKEKLLNNNDEIIKWLTQHNINIQDVAKLKQSDSYKERLRKNAEKLKLYSPEFIPMAVLNGKYILIKNTLYNDDYTYAVLDFLVDKLQKEQQGVTK